MFRLKKIVCVLFFITTFVSAQVKRVQFISDENQLPLSDVEVYDGNVLIGKSDPNGYFDVKTGDSNELSLIKEEYKASVIKVRDLQKKVTLFKKQPIALKEVVIGKQMSLRKILDGIQRTLDYRDREERIEEGMYKSSFCYNVANKLLMETDTLHYLNGLIKFRMETGSREVCSIDKNFRLVKKIKQDTIHGGMFYYINKKSMSFFVGYDENDWHLVRFLTVPHFLDSDGVLVNNILERRRNYEYTVTNIDDFYKIEFVSKNKFPFGFNGYLIVDKTDFGIYKFKAHLTDNVKNNKKLLQSGKEEIYHVITTDYYTKLQKDKDGVYQILCSYSERQLEQTQGNFKGKKISWSSIVEATNNYKNAEFLDFDLIRYELKEKAPTAPISTVR